MKWFVEKLAGAFIAGVGWKLGTDLYQAIKDRMEAEQKKKEEEKDAESNGVAATSGTSGAADDPHEDRR